MDKQQQELLLLGDEAVALGAIHAGINGVYSYPGTPASEIFEYVERIRNSRSIHAVWSANEKVAYEEALGVSFAGRRALVSMKHVGLNVAADAFVNSALTGVNGGLVVAVADDPGMHSSQNEQDSRYYAAFAKIPCLEPRNQQEAYNMTRYAFNLSEKLGLPVMLRLVTRLAHSRSKVVPGKPRAQNPLSRTTDFASWTLLPSNARRQFRKLLDKQPRIDLEVENSGYNELLLNGENTTMGIITSGIAYNYVMEVFQGKCPYPLLRIGMYPIPVKLVRELAEMTEKLLVVEEGYPFIEEKLRGIGGCGWKIAGKIDGTLPDSGELRPEIVAQGIGISLDKSNIPKFELLAPRPPALCPGCPHIDTFRTINEAVSIYKQPTVFSDIGCYTLGFYPPLNAIHTCVEMGASVGMAAGAAHAGAFPVLCAIGDSTFCHSGLPGLLGAAKENVNMNLFILDNGTVAMTGIQETMATGQRLVDLVAGLGVSREHIKTFVPLSKNMDENVRLIRKEIEYPGLSVVIPQRACVHLAKKLRSQK